MSDKHEFLEFSYMGEKVTYPASDVRLYTFMGELACYNHVFLVDKGEEDDTYAYLFSSHPLYEPVVQFIEDNDWQQSLNCRSIDPQDIEVFELMHYFDVRGNESFPDAWVDKEGEADE